MIGMKPLPSDTNAVLEKVSSLPGVYWVARLAGRYDLFALTVWQDPADLSRFLGTHLGTIPGIRHIEPAIFMDTRKMKFAHIVSSHLEAVRSRQGRSLAC